MYFQVILSGMPQHGFGLTLYGDYLYWTDWILRSVIQANKYTGQEVLYLKKNIPRQPMGIVAVAKDATNCMFSTLLNVHSNAMFPHIKDLNVFVKFAVMMEKSVLYV